MRGVGSARVGGSPPAAGAKAEDNGSSPDLPPGTPRPRRLRAWRRLLGGFGQDRGGVVVEQVAAARAADPVRLPGVGHLHRPPAPGDDADRPGLARRERDADAGRADLAEPDRRGVGGGQGLVGQQEPGLVRGRQADPPDPVARPFGAEGERVGPSRRRVGSPGTSASTRRPARRPGSTPPACRPTGARVADRRYFPLVTCSSSRAESAASFQAQSLVSVQAPWLLPRRTCPVPRQAPTSGPNRFSAAWSAEPRRRPLRDRVARPPLDPGARHDQHSQARPAADRDPPHRVPPRRLGDGSPCPLIEPESGGRVPPYPPARSLEAPAEAARAGRVALILTRRDVCRGRSVVYHFVREDGTTVPSAIRASTSALIVADNSWKAAVTGLVAPLAWPARIWSRMAVVVRPEAIDRAERDGGLVAGDLGLEELEVARRGRTVRSPPGSSGC